MQTHLILPLHLSSVEGNVGVLNLMGSFSLFSFKREKKRQLKFEFISKLLSCEQLNHLCVGSPKEEYRG